MSSYDNGPFEDEDEVDPSKAATFAGLLFLGLGLLFGCQFGGDEKADAALNWAVQATGKCEKSYRADGYDSVTDCLRGTIDEAEEQRREDLQGEDDGPE